MRLWLPALLLAAPAFAQETIVTDRPDQTDGPVVVPPGTLQVETGVTLQGDDGVDVLGVPGTLLRYAPSRRLELRLGWPGWVRVDTGRNEVDGLGDPELGAKLVLASQPGAALIANVSLPAGDEDVGAPGAAPSLKLSVAHTLAERIGLGWNVGIDTSSTREAQGDTHLLARWIYTASMDFELSDTWGTFLEV